MYMPQSSDHIVVYTPIRTDLLARSARLALLHESEFNSNLVSA